MWALRVLSQRCTRTPDIVCATVLQKSQKFRVRVWGSYRTYRSSGYGTEVLQNSQKFRVLWHGRTELTHVVKNYIPVPRVFVALAYGTSRSSGYAYERHTELPKVPGTGMNVLQNLQKFFVM